MAASESCRPMSVTMRRVGEQESPGGQAERRDRTRGPTTLAREEDHTAHDGGTDDAGLRTGEQRVAGDGHHDREAARPTAKARGPQHAADDAGHEGDVPAADGDDVGEPGGREVLGDGTAHPLPEADEDAGRETGFGLRERSRERGIDPPAELLYDGSGTGAWGDELERGRLQRPGCAACGEKAREARSVFGRRLHATLDQHEVTGDERGMARQPGVDAPSGSGPPVVRQREERALLGARRRGQVIDPGLPDAAAGRDRDSVDGLCVEPDRQGHSEGYGPDAEEQGSESGPILPDGDDRDRHQCRRPGGGHERARAWAHDTSRAETRRCDGAARQPGGPRHPHQPAARTRASMSA